MSKMQMQGGLRDVEKYNHGDSHSQDDQNYILEGYWEFGIL